MFRKFAGFKGLWLDVVSNELFFILLKLVRELVQVQLGPIFKTETLKTNRHTLLPPRDL